VEGTLVERQCASRIDPLGVSGCSNEKFRLLR